MNLAYLWRVLPKKNFHALSGIEHTTYVCLHCNTKFYIHLHTVGSIRSPIKQIKVCCLFSSANTAMPMFLAGCEEEMHIEMAESTLLRLE